MLKRFIAGQARLGTLFCAAVTMLAATSVCRADTIFSVSVDTTNLASKAAGPFTLDFQFNDGTQANNNTATITSFSFGTGGAAAGSATASGDGSGNLTSGIVIHDSSAFNSLDQGFTPGSLLKFDVDLTTAVDAGGTPDQFSFAILDKDLVELGTTDPSGANTIITVNVDSANPTILQYQSSPPTFGTVTVSTPEPASLGWVVLGAVSLLARRKERPSAASLS